MRVVGGGGFSIQWVVVFCENVILWVVVLLKHAVLWVSSFKWELVGCLGLNTRMRKNSSNSLKAGSPEKKELCGWLTDNLILWLVGLNSN